MRVLLVDDEPDDLVAILTGHGFNAGDVIVCDKPDNVVALVEELASSGRAPDAILVDALMPRVEGKELAPKLVKFGIPVAIMSGSEYFAVSGFAFIAKPGDPAEFDAKIRALRKDPTNE